MYFPYSSHSYGTRSSGDARVYRGRRSTKVVIMLWVREDFLGSYPTSRSKREVFDLLLGLLQVPRLATPRLAAQCVTISGMVVCRCGAYTHAVKKISWACIPRLRWPAVCVLSKTPSAVSNRKGGVPQCAPQQPSHIRIASPSKEKKYNRAFFGTSSTLNPSGSIGSIDKSVLFLSNDNDMVHWIHAGISRLGAKRG